MPSVTNRIKQTKQPRGGYINPKDFHIIQLNDTFELNVNQNIHASIVGMAVDYLTRINLNENCNGVFRVALRGATLINDIDHAHSLLKKVNKLDDISIISACKLSGYDVITRAGLMGYKPVQDINPDSDTIENIRIMVNRSISFIEEYGPVTLSGFTFEGAYTDLISSGDGDFLTDDTLWDFKVSVSPPTNKHTLQLLIYYLMGRKSVHKEFKSINKLGFFNPA